jgi:hypothetical protein
VLPVISRAKRILRPMSRFQFFDGQPSPVPTDLPLPETETPIGMYLNEPGSLEDAVVVTDLSLLLESKGTWVPIPYSSISKIATPTTKAGVQGLRLFLHDGSTVCLPIRGGTQRTSDAFEFLRFLDRVLADRKAA